MPRPDRVTKEQKSMGPRAPMHTILDQLSAKHVKAIEDNENVKACCRKIENLEVETFKTDPDLAVADMMKFTCTKCGCAHYRAAVSGGRQG